MDTVLTKSCSRCGVEKPLDEFPRRANAPHGRASGCKSCDSERNARYRAANAERIRARKAAYHAANAERLRAYQAEYRAANSEKVAARERAYRERNAEAIKKRNAEYYAANREEYLAKGRERRAANPHKAWERKYRLRAEAAGCPVVIVPFVKDDVIRLYGDACFYCHSAGFEHLDHFIPVSKGGHHTLENVRPSCATCNRSKGDVIFDAAPEAGMTPQ